MSKYIDVYANRFMHVLKTLSKTAHVIIFQGLGAKTAHLKYKDTREFAVEKKGGTRFGVVFLLRFFTTLKKSRTHLSGLYINNIRV